MKKNYKKEFILLIDKNIKNGIEYGKPIEYLEFKNGVSRQDIEKEITNCSQIEFVDKQEETRYKAYFVYSSKSGRVYVIKFTNKIRIITIYPLGPTP